MSRFYVRPEAVKAGKIYVEKEESHHIIDVMRLGEGDPVTVFDGTGKEYKGRIASTESKKVIINVVEAKSADKKLPINITLAQALPKKDKMDLIVRKGTELGADVILPVESARTIVRPKEKKKRQKKERWQKKAIEAAKQCGRTELPKVRDIVRFEDMIKCVPKYDLAVMPCLSDKAVPLKSVLKNAKRPKTALIIIGPEGGFTEGEIAKASENGAILVSLGKLTLRSDTAAIATLSVLSSEYST